MEFTIISMADRQTSAAYLHNGTVISSDIPKVTHLVPNGKIRFCPISIEEAQNVLLKWNSFI
ncbi:hypothetical protein QGM71_05175 [Virgibacillus sp. C22-A2]|uniref:Carboxyltransferase domain-containing protein n=1 Tax=Virgibacillus tibetensis TaxID=3042313 RepID=A0ABU6KCW0_9BACI|nr:hypothetical protein [Virgibacillus sp. C22-A2]